MKKILMLLVLAGTFASTMMARGDEVRRLSWDPFDKSVELGDLVVGEEVEIWIDFYGYDIDRVTGLPPGLEFHNGDFCLPSGICTLGIDFLEGVPSKTGSYNVTFSTAQYRGGSVIKSVTRTIRVVRPSVTVAFDANGGSCSVSSKTYEVGGKFGTLPTPTCPGYVSIGWFTEWEGGDLVTVDSIVPESGLTLYAHWREAEKIGNYYWLYEIEDGYARIYGVAPTPSGKLTIPPLIDGYPVKWFASIYGEEELMDLSRVTAFEFPSSLTFVDAIDIRNSSWFKSQTGAFVRQGEWVFGRKTAASTLEIPIGVKKIAANARFNGTITGAISFPEGLTDICYQSPCGGVPQSLTPQIRLPASVKTIGVYSFWDMPLGSAYYCEGDRPTLTDWAGRVVDDDHLANGCVFPYDSIVYYRQSASGWTDGERWGCAIMRPWPTVDITFDANGGSCPVEVQAYEFEASYGALPMATREGYKFLGWFTSAVGGMKVTESFLVTAATTLYAHWREEIDGIVCVPGEKIAVDTGLIGYTASRLPSGLSFSRSSGMLTGAVAKHGEYAVEFSKAGEDTVELTIVVTAIPAVTVALEGVNAQSDTNGCKVTGAGAYLVGKKVTLRATAPKGTAFVGWSCGGRPWPTAADSAKSSVTYEMGKEDVSLVAKFKKEVMAVGCEGLSAREYLPAGVLGAEGGIALDIMTESGVKSVKVDKLPAGMKYDAKSERITGAPIKAGDNTVVITVTAVSGAVEKKEIRVKVAAMPETAVGTFNGFISSGEVNIGTFTLAATDAGKLTAKVVTAAGTVSFSGSCWDAVEEGVYRAKLTTKKGDFMTLSLDSNAEWDANQLTGTYSPPNVWGWQDLSAQRNAFGKIWYFTAVGNEAAGWTFAYTKDAKAAALTVALKADGTTSIAGTLSGTVDAKTKKATSFRVSASGVANVGLVREGAIAADFAPVLTVNREKKVLAIKTNLWFDRKNDHGDDIGEARFVK